MPRATLLAAIVSIVVVGLALAAVAGARTRSSDPFEITADSIRYDAKDELYTAEGHVHLLQTARSLTANWVAYSKKTGIGVAEGDVELVDGGDRLQAAFMVFDIDTLQGTLYQVSLDSGTNGFRVRAKEMIRTGKNTFTVNAGTYNVTEDGTPISGYTTTYNNCFFVAIQFVLWYAKVIFKIDGFNT